jgi:hypothetical protein
MAINDDDFDDLLADLGDAGLDDAACDDVNGPQIEGAGESRAEPGDADEGHAAAAAAAAPAAAPAAAVHAPTSMAAKATPVSGAIFAAKAAKIAPVAAAKASKPAAAAAAVKPAAKSASAAKPAARPAAAKPRAPPAGKRGPGRPSNKPPPPALERKGIVASPDNPENRLEFVYGDPLLFKALFAYLKNVKARQIHVRCARQGITFYTRDHAKTSRIVANVPGALVNWHYCEDDFWININRESVEKIFGGIDKTFYKMTFMITHDDPKHIHIVFKDAAIDKECNYQVTLSTYEADPDLYEVEALLVPAVLKQRFPIEFTLTAKQFKKTVTDASNLSENVTFEKFGENPLQITYAKAGITYTEVYRTPAKIKLRSSVSDGDTFRCTVAVANVKSLATSMVTEDVRILCRADGDMLIRSALDDKALVVSTFVKCS